MHSPIIRSRSPLNHKRCALQGLVLKKVVAGQSTLWLEGQVREGQDKLVPVLDLDVEELGKEAGFAHALVPVPEVPRVEPDVEAMQVGQEGELVADALPGVGVHRDTGVGVLAATVATVAVAKGRVGAFVFFRGWEVELGHELGGEDADFEGADGELFGAASVEGEPSVCFEEVGEDEGGVGDEGREGFVVPGGVDC